MLLVFYCDYRYGDRSPSSICGKCFGIIWILAGIIILSIFTAAVTTALSSGADTDNDPLSGHKVHVNISTITTNNNKTLINRGWLYQCSSTVLPKGLFGAADSLIYKDDLF